MKTLCNIELQRCRTVSVCHSTALAVPKLNVVAVFCKTPLVQPSLLRLKQQNIKARRQIALKTARACRVDLSDS